MSYAVVATENGKVHHTTDFDSESDAREYLDAINVEISLMLTYNDLTGSPVTTVRLERNGEEELDALEFDSINHPGVVVRYQVQQLDD